MSRPGAGAQREDPLGLEAGLGLTLGQLHLEVELAVGAGELVVANRTAATPTLLDEGARRAQERHPARCAMA